MAYSSSWVDTSLDLNLNPRRFLHHHAPPLLSQTESLDLSMKLSVKEETNALAEELNRVNEENKKLTEMISVVCENYNVLRNRLLDYMNKNPDHDHQKELCPVSKKRKSESSHNTSSVVNVGNNGNAESSSTDEDRLCKKVLKEEESIKAKTTTSYVRTEASDTTLIVKDGYQWRKYGQKVTRDNPCPRAYFKCSFAPSCPVKKKVQRSVEDQGILVATYEGEHNHPAPSQLEATSAATRGASTTNGGSGLVPFSASISPFGPTNISLDVTKSKSKNVVIEAESSSGPRMDRPEVQKFLVEQMASSLTNDPNFTAVLAAAISGRILSQ